MYENEIYSGDNAGSNTSGETKGTYFDYTTYPTEELEKRAELSREQRRRQEKADRKTARREAKAAKMAAGKGRIFRKFALSVSLGLCFGLFAGAGFYGVQLVTGQTKQAVNDSALTQTVTPVPEEKVSEALKTATQVTYVQNDISDVVEQVMPAMVSIMNNYTTTTTDFWGQSYAREAAASGSGIIVAENDNELLIVSNNHVVEGAEKLEVTFLDGATAEASIKGLDSDMDLAVIAVSDRKSVV